MENKDLIPWDLADELKELGFQGGQGRVYQQDLGMCEQILWQQAFRWFREKYGMLSYIKEYWDDDVFVSFEAVIQTINGYYGCFGITYEEAELACLKKLIEIAKNK